MAGYGTVTSAKTFKGFFTCAADRAFPVIRQIFKLGSFRGLAFTITLIRVIDISAVGYLTLIHIFRFCHYYISLSCYNWNRGGRTLQEKSAREYTLLSVAERRNNIINTKYADYWSCQW